MTKNCIDLMSANFGGTDILRPMKNVLMNLDFKRSRVFLLTDGQVNNKYEIVNLVKQYCSQSNDDCRVFTFGVGNDCDKSLVKEIAEAGHGSYNFAADANLNVLKTKVIDALAKAQDPALNNCTFDFGIKNS